MRNRTYFLALPALLGLFVYSTGCDSSSNPVAPTGSVLTLSANPAFISLNGTSTINIVGFKPDGNPLNPGTQINLTSTMGTISPTIVSADESGRASATLTASGQAGQATVSASLPGGDTTADVTVEIGEQQPVLEISANPTTVPVNGSATITVVARDFNGFPLRNDGPIVLTASNGTVNSNRVRTNGNGVATAIFNAGDDASSGSGTVSAFLRNSETVSVDITIRDAPSRLALTADPVSIDRTNEGVPITLTALVTNEQGVPLGNVLVTFESVPAIGEFSQQVVPTSTSQGRATTTLTVDEADVNTIPPNGTFEVRATVTTDGNVVSNEDPVFITVR